MYRSNIWIVFCLFMFSFSWLHASVTVYMLGLMRLLLSLFVSVGTMRVVYSVKYAFLSVSQLFKWVGDMDDINKWFHNRALGDSLFSNFAFIFGVFYDFDFQSLYFNVFSPDGQVVFYPFQCTVLKFWILNLF